jgi:hypothetical protein
VSADRFPCWDTENDPPSRAWGQSRAAAAAFRSQYVTSILRHGHFRQIELKIGHRVRRQPGAPGAARRAHAETVDHSDPADHARMDGALPDTARQDH